MLPQNKPYGFQELFGQLSQRYDFNFGLSFIESEVGLDYSCGSIPTQNIL